MDDLAFVIVLLQAKYADAAGLQRYFEHSISRLLLT